MHCEKSVKKFIHHCQDLIMERTKNTIFNYVYITEENEEKLLVFIECIAQRNNRLVLSHALTQTFVSFLAKNVYEVVDEIIKVNGELILTYHHIVEGSHPNYDAELFIDTKRYDSSTISYSFEDGVETKINKYTLFSPFTKPASMGVLAELSKRLGETCTTIYENYSDNDDEYKQTTIKEKLTFYNDEHKHGISRIEKTTTTTTTTIDKYTTNWGQNY